FFVFHDAVVPRILPQARTGRCSDLHSVGEPLAVVVAAARYTAADAARAVRVSYEPLPVMATVEDALAPDAVPIFAPLPGNLALRSEEHTSELQSRENLVCRLLLEKK